MSTLFTGGPIQTPLDEKRCWRTDRLVANHLFARYGVPLLDAAATNADVALAPCWIPPETDALRPEPWWERASGRDVTSWPTPEARWSVSWTPSVWLNPPWGTGKTGTPAWIDRALLELDAKRVCRILLLVPEATDTAWWWKAAERATEVVSLGRIAYCRPSGERISAPPQGSTLFVLDPPARTPSPDSLLRPEGATSPPELRRVRSFVAWDLPRRGQQLAARLSRVA